MLPIFDINVTAFTIWEYPMSWVELIGTLFGLISVWLTAKNKVSGYPVGIINIIFFVVLFYQIQLYSDVSLNVYFLFATFYGWWAWTHPKAEAKTPTNELKVTRISLKEMIVIGVMIMGSTVVLGSFALQLSIWLPMIFPEPASYPYWDAFTSMLSIVAMILMAQKKVESWVLWIIADVIDITLYTLKDVRLVAIEYVIFLIIAVYGLVGWIKIMHTPDWAIRSDYLPNGIRYRDDRAIEEMEAEHEKEVQNALPIHFDSNSITI